MEELLKLLMKDAQAAKFAPIRQSCKAAIDILEDKVGTDRLPAYLLRERCLDPLQLAIESKTKRLMSHAVSGIEKLLKDERFQSSIETECEERWLPIQVLNTVYSTPNLPEDIQVDVMKLLLKMTFSTAWCMNSRIITQVAQVYIETYCSHAHSNNLKGVVQAALTQLLGSFAEKLRLAVLPGEHAEDDVLTDFNAKGDSKIESLTEDVVMLLKFLTDKVTAAHKAGHNKQATPLLLEGIFSILTNSPAQLRTNFAFQQLVWQDLCPTLISLLGLPKADVKQKPGSDHGVNMECPGLAPNTAKVIYSISVTLVKMVGPVPSLRPVLESLFHRILMCTALQHRHDAIKAVKELLVSPVILCDLTVTYGSETDRSRKPASQSNDLTLIKLIVDSIQECCHSNDSGICFTSVTCIGDLLSALEMLDRGVGIHPDSVAVIKAKYRAMAGKKMRTASNRTISTTSQSDVEEQSRDVLNENTTSNCSTVEPEPGVIDSRAVGEDTTVEPIEDSDVAGLANYKELERQSARMFVEELLAVLSHLLSVATVTEVDEMLQKFSSTFSDNVSARESSQSETKSLYLGAVLNADSIYSTSYAALCLSLKLALHGFYSTRDKTCIPVSERQFIDSVLDTDMFLYLSPDWLAQVYKCILERDLLSEAGWGSDEDTPLITCLKDIDGHGSPAVGDQMMGDSVFTEETETLQSADSEGAQAGKLLCGQILVTCLDGVLDVLSASLGSGNSSGGVTNSFALMLGMEGARDDVLRKRDALCQGLDGLQTVAKLCCSLGLQERCAAVFSLLADTSCVMEDFKRATQPIVSDKASQKSSSIMPQVKPKLVRLHAAHVLSMDSMMTTGLEIGSHSADCWKHVFRCCAFISELEHTYFSSGNNQSSLPRIQQEQTPGVNITLEDSDADLYGVPMAPVVPVAPRINVKNLIKQSSLESGWDRSITGGGLLNHAQASQALCGLSQEVDKLFEEAANNLNMVSLASFLGALCEASKHQLARITRRLAEEDEEGPAGPDHHSLPVNSLHLYRLQTVLLTVAHSARPLIHLLKAWSVVSSYLVESAGHRDRSISKMAVSIVHDYIVAVMSGHLELKHFHTNEMLCKTFENILCLELCDGDVQDQIVCSICELVEASACDIRSGWRPLFGALRAVRIEYSTVEEVNEARGRHVEAVLDVFDVYLSTDNILVFANATVDCILCLLKYVRGPGEFEDSDTEDSDSMSDYMTGSPGSENLCLPALQYLKQCSVILQSMWNMPACPVFHGAKRIQVNTAHRCVDPNIPNMDFKKFSKYFVPVEEEIEGSNTSGPSSLSPRMGLLSAEDMNAGDSSSLLSNDSGILVSSNKDAPDADAQPGSGSQLDPASLDELDTSTGILHVWFLLLEGLSGAVSACPRSYQPQTMETMFELLRSASHVPGTKFTVYCMNHLLLPMLQAWLRSGSRKYGYWDTGATNFKQCCGHTTDLVVDLIHDFKEDKAVCVLLESVLVKLLQVLAECVAQPYEVISRLGCSCIRHILLSASGDFTEAMWQIIIDGLQHALDVTTYNVRQLMLVFRAHSENFYGDVGQVKVATRKDCSATEFYRMWHLAQQVFLLDSQVSCDPPVTNDEDKSYVLLLYPPGYENSLNPDHILARIPFRSIVVGLLSHQLLLQTVGCILLEGNAKPDSPMPGMLSQLSTSHVNQLLGCLMGSYQLACEFDLRPGLKFLLQKVAHTVVAVNLYKQAGAAMVFYIHTLIKICSNIPGLDMTTVRGILAKQNDAKPQKDIVKDSPASKLSQNDRTCAEKDLNDEKVKEEGQGHIQEKGQGDYSRELGQGKNDSTSQKVNEQGHGQSKDVGQGDGPVKNADDDESGCQNDGSGATTNDESKTESSNADTKSEKSESVGTKAEKVENVQYIQKADAAKEKPGAISPNIVDNASLFVSQLMTVCDELCQNYMDIVYDKAGTSCVDSLGSQQLFFLIAQPDEFPEVPHSKVDVEKLNTQLQQAQARFQGVAMTTMSVQEEPEVSSPKSTKPEELPPLSPVHSQPAKSKRELRNENESRVYNLATDKLIKNLMTEYKKRKNQNVMPTFAGKGKPKEKKEKKTKKKQSADPVEQVIEQQQQSSIMKDSEAHVQSWTELLCTILGLLQQLDDARFTTLLPPVFPCVNLLVCHAQDMRLREELAQWLHRVGVLFTLCPDQGK